MFSSWLVDLQVAANDDERKRLEEEEADLVVGPQLPGSAAAGGGHARDYGGALLPGEGDRCAIMVVRCCTGGLCTRVRLCAAVGRG